MLVNFVVVKICTICDRMQTRITHNSLDKILLVRICVTEGKIKQINQDEIWCTRERERERERESD